MSTTKKRNGTTRERRSSLAAGSLAPQGPTGDEILGQYQLGQLIIQMKDVLKYAELIHNSLSNRIAEKRAAVQGNTQGLVTPGTGQSAENAPASRRHQ